MTKSKLQRNIPQEWQTLPLERLAIKKGLVRGPFGGALKKEFFVESGYKIYEQKNAIYSSVELGNYYIDPKKFQELKRFSVKGGDFIVSCSGTIGKIFQIPNSAPEGVINQALLKITTNSDVINDRFFYYHFLLPEFQTAVIDSTQGGAMQNLVGMDIFKKTTMVVPPLTEQNRIVSVLDLWDQAIEKLKQKIEIKKEVRKGLMQELLTGKTRLPGFSGDWKQVELKNIGIFSKGAGILKNEVTTSGHCAVRYGELYTKYDFEIRTIFSHIPDEVISSTKKIKFGDVLFAGSGETIDEIGKSAVYLLQEDCYAGGDIIVFTPKNADGLFLSHFMNTGIARKKLREIGQGQSVVHLYKSDLEKLSFKLPEKKEQEAISSILTLARYEINQLQKKLEILHSQKKFLLNNLITGTIRTPETLSTK